VQKVTPRTAQEGYNRRMDAASEFRQLVTDYRERCLWFLEKDYFPATPEEQAKVLGYIERHGDLAAHQRAARIRQWLSLPTSA
jgi:hypothetical protein